MIAFASIKAIFGWTALAAAVVAAVGVVIVKLALDSRQRCAPTAPATRKAEHNQSSKVLGVAVALAGFAGYFYVFGGAQLFMNFTAAHPPSRHRP